MIKIVNLSKTYEKDKKSVEALKNINLEVKKGSIHGIIGLSGAGKSSLIRCINRIEKPTSGEVWIKDINIMNLSNKELRKIRKKIGMIFQSFNLLNSKTVFDNIAFPLRLSKVPESIIKEKVYSLLELVELKDKVHTYPSNLSGGQKQRVAIARALANDPEVLLCDEATSALDPKTTKQILALLKDINKKLNLTMIVVTHEMEVIKNICDYVTILEGGEIIEEGNTVDIFSNPKNITTKHFVGQIHNLTINFSNGKILYLSFTKDSARKPIITQLIKKFNLDINILFGNIEYIGESPIGKLILKINSNYHDLSEVISYLEANDVKVEVFENEGIDKFANTLLA